MKNQFCKYFAFKDFKSAKKETEKESNFHEVFNRSQYMTFDCQNAEIITTTLIGIFLQSYQ